MSKEITAAGTTEKINQLREEVKKLSRELDQVGLNGGRVPANDPKQKRIDTLRKQIKQLGASVIEANTVDGSEEKQAAIRELIAIFLQLNPDPSDDQFHHLALSLGTDPATLESVAYEMLGEAVDGEEIEAEDLDEPNLVGAFRIQASTRIKSGLALVKNGGQGDVGISEDQKVRQGDYDEDEIPVDDILIGELSLDDPDTGFQEEQYDDGLPSTDDSDGTSTGDNSVMINDGVVDKEI
jgi:hypothetical protein